ncbi:MAG: hypothetical protein ACI9U2_000327 [Bradymonadia bacterium]
MSQYDTKKSAESHAVEGPSGIEWRGLASASGQANELRAASIQFSGGDGAGAVQQIATAGTAGGGGGALPFLPQVQSAFGRHDVSHVQAFVGGQAADANAALGSQAYAQGDRVAFKGAPTLHTAAHEAAHVVQQQAGVQLKGGVGQIGDKYEQHADRVADAVVQGRSAEPLLSEMTGGSQASDAATTQFNLEPAVIAQAQGTLRSGLSTWYTNSRTDVETNRNNGARANNRLIEFEESGIEDLKSVGGVASGVAGVFGTAGAVVGVCINVLVEVAARNLSNKAQKKAASAAALDARRTMSNTALQTRRNNVDQMIGSIQTQSRAAAARRAIAALQVSETATENIIYRDLLLALAGGGGHHVTGSDWHERNFGRFYSSWDTGWPFHIGGSDIASELNDLAAGDPSVRVATQVNEKAHGTWGPLEPDNVPQQGQARR